MNKQQKIIGTLLPVSALYSLQQKDNDQGTFIIGLDFLEWIKTTHQSVWQMLPLHQTQLEQKGSSKRVPSPYKSYGIGLNPKYLSSAYLTLIPTKQELDKFVKENRGWINDYALFCALADHFQTDDWRQWGHDLKNRDHKILALWRSKLTKEINKHITVQWQLYQSYMELRNKAKKLGITLSGDLPFYICVQSPLVWAHQAVFDLEKDGSMRYISGVPNIPPSFFGRQVWGHPLYKWESKKNRKEIIVLWKMRLHYLSELYDLIRFDYAKAFYNYGTMDIKNIQNDGYRIGPGASVFEELIRFCKKCRFSVFVEDSGNKIDEMRKSMKTLNSPGIKILRFGLDEKKDLVMGEYADVLHYPEFTVAYTTTHDTETLLGYINILTQEQKQRLAIAANVAYNPDDKIFAKILRDAVLESPAQIIIIPMQDWLLIKDRINVPGTETPINDQNWQFRLRIPVEKLPTNF